jgi:hypothetical protein
MRTFKACRSWRAFILRRHTTFGFTSVEANELRAMLAEVRKLG